MIESSVDGSARVEDGSGSNNSIVDDDESEGVFTAVYVFLLLIKL